jgi:multiple sugar transport system permease protein
LATLNDHTTGLREHGLSARHQRMLPYLLLAPAAGFLLVVHLIPMAAGVYMSFLKLNQGHLAEFLHAPFTGLGNYAFVLLDPLSPIRDQFGGTLRNTVIYTVAVNVLSLAAGLAAALAITREFRGRGVVRTLLLLPWIVPTYVVGILWGFMWQPDGIINHVLHDVLHLPIRPFWLVGPLTLVGIIVPTAWRAFPFTMLMLSAGLTGISADLYEAAEMDGASAWQQLRHITLPLLRPVLAVLVLFGIIANVYSFNIFFTMFGHGAGYPGDWGDLLMTMIFRNSFAGLNFGTGAATSVLLMAICVTLVALWFWVFREDLSIR